VTIGAPAGPNGKLYIAGKVPGHSGINLYNGTSDDGIDVDLDTTGLLETVDASITLNPGGNGVIRGDVFARGTASDAVINSTNNLELHGELEAERNIVISAGTVTTPGTHSIQTVGTNSIETLGGGGQILVTGLNDVSINSQLGPGSLSPRLTRPATSPWRGHCWPERVWTAIWP
jgi:hypothetical protein